VHQRLNITTKKAFTAATKLTTSNFQDEEEAILGTTTSFSPNGENQHMLFLKIFVPISFLLLAAVGALFVVVLAKRNVNTQVRPVEKRLSDVVVVSGVAVVLVEADKELKVVSSEEAPHTATTIAESRT
jgi:hypothetical protein